MAATIYAKAIGSFVAKGPDFLTLKKNDLVKVTEINKDSGWAKGQIITVNNENGDIVDKEDAGSFPYHYVKIIQNFDPKNQLINEAGEAKKSKKERPKSTPAGFSINQIEYDAEIQEILKENLFSGESQPIVRAPRKTSTLVRNANNANNTNSPNNNNTPVKHYADRDDLTSSGGLINDAIDESEDPFLQRRSSAYELPQFTFVPNVALQAVAIADFQIGDRGLSFRKGDLVDVISAAGDASNPRWWVIEIDGVRGIAPVDSIQFLENDPEVENELRKQLETIKKQLSKERSWRIETMDKVDNVERQLKGLQMEYFRLQRYMQIMLQKKAEKVEKVIAKALRNKETKISFAEMNVRTEHIQPYVYKSLMPFESITFSRNKLTHIHANICYCAPTLTELRLDFNNLMALPNEIGYLKNLTHLVLCKNKLNEIPEDIGNLSNLIVLNLQANYLSDLPASIGNLTNLKALNIAQNSFTTLPDCVFKLNGLLQLSAKKNMLTRLPAAVENLTNLKGLSLSGNKISELPMSLLKLTSLNKITLHDNKLHTVPGRLYQLTNLQILSLADNPLHAPYSELIDQSCDKILAWLRDFDSKKNEVFGSPSLDDKKISHTLRDPQGRKRFEDFLKVQLPNYVVVFQFWRDVDALAKAPLEERLDKARGIFDHYVKTDKLPITPAAKAAIEMRFDSGEFVEDVEQKVHPFQELQRFAVELLESKCLPRYRRSGFTKNFSESSLTRPKSSSSPMKKQVSGTIPRQDPATPRLNPEEPPKSPEGGRKLNVEHSIKIWMSSVLEELVPATSLFEATRDGVILIRVFNAVHNNNAKLHLRIYNNEPKKNIKAFLTGCERMGLKKKLLFKSSDYKKGNNKRIVSGLTYFMECCKKPVPTLSGSVSPALSDGYSSEGSASPLTRAKTVVFHGLTIPEETEKETSDDEALGRSSDFGSMSASIDSSLNRSPSSLSASHSHSNNNSNTNITRSEELPKKKSKNKIFNFFKRASEKRLQAKQKASAATSTSGDKYSQEEHVSISSSSSDS